MPETLFSLQLIVLLVNGGYSEWTDWDLCDNMGGCDNQLSEVKRVRTCDRPTKALDGDDCDTNLASAQESPTGQF